VLKWKETTTFGDEPTDLWSRLIHGGKDSYLGQFCLIGILFLVLISGWAARSHLGYSYTAIDLFAGLAFSMVGLIALSMSLRTALTGV